MKNWLKRVLTLISTHFRFSRTPTIRYTFSLVFVLAVAMTIASAISSGKSEIIIETNKTQVGAGDTFSVKVYALAKTPVNAVTVKVSFPTENIEILGIDRGESVITLWTSDPRVEDGVVILEGGTYRKGFVGKHLIATINVKAKNEGQASIVTKDANLLAGDGRGTEVATDISGQGQKVMFIGGMENQIEGEAVVFVATDLDGDGKVTLDDIGNFMLEWVKHNNRYDFNNDGIMSFRDFSIILAHYFSGN